MKFYLLKLQEVNKNIFAGSDPLIVSDIENVKRLGMYNVNESLILADMVSNVLNTIRFNMGTIPLVNNHLLLMLNQYRTCLTNTCNLNCLKAYMLWDLRNVVGFMGALTTDEILRYINAWDTVYAQNYATSHIGCFQICEHCECTDRDTCNVLHPVGICTCNSCTRHNYNHMRLENYPYGTDVREIMMDYCIHNFLESFLVHRDLVIDSKWYSAPNVPGLVILDNLAEDHYDLRKYYHLTSYEELPWPIYLMIRDFVYYKRDL